jgi:hypothetical protein
MVPERRQRPAVRWDREVGAKCPVTTCLSPSPYLGPMHSALQFHLDVLELRRMRSPRVFR